MRQPIDTMSAYVLDLMLELINQPQQREETLIRVPPELVTRQSTGLVRG